jgi:hypothetical protein
MAGGLPCPNPACKHVFASSEIKGAATLTCPRCMRVFRFVVDARGTTRLVASKAGPGKSGSEIDVELVTPQGLPVPRAAVPVTIVGPVSIVPPSVMEQHRRRKPGSRLSVIMGSLVAVLVVSLVLAGYFMFRPAPEEKHEPPGKRFSAAPPSSRRDPGDDHPPQPTEVLRGEQCEVEVPVGVWTKFKASEEDEQADLFLKGRWPQAKDDPAKNATVLVVVLENKASNLSQAAQLARNRLEEQRRLQDATARLVPVVPPTESEPVGDRRGHVAQLKLEIAQQPQKCIVLAVVNDGDKWFAICCECGWDNRQLWQSDFREILKMFRITKTAG